MRYAIALLVLISCKSTVDKVNYSAKIRLDHQGPSDAWQIGIEIMVSLKDTVFVSKRINSNNMLIIEVDSSTFSKTFKYIESKETEFHYDPSLIGLSVSISSFEGYFESQRYSIITRPAFEKFLRQLINEIENEKTEELVESIEQLFISSTN